MDCYGQGKVKIFQGWKSQGISQKVRNSLMLSKSVKSQEICESNALCKKYRQKQKEVENEQKNISDLQKKATLTNGLFLIGRRSVKTV